MGFLGKLRTARWAVPLIRLVSSQIAAQERPALRRLAILRPSTLTRGPPSRFPQDFARDTEGTPFVFSREQPLTFATCKEHLRKRKLARERSANDSHRESPGLVPLHSHKLYQRGTVASIPRWSTNREESSIRMQSNGCPALPGGDLF